MSALPYTGGTMGRCYTSERYFDLLIEVETDLVDEVLQSLSAKLSLDLGKHGLYSPVKVMKCIRSNLPMGLNSGEYDTFHTGMMLSCS